jgi:hypothetical protein
MLALRSESIQQYQAIKPGVRSCRVALSIYPGKDGKHLLHLTTSLGILDSDRLGVPRLGPSHLTFDGD